MAKVTGIGGVFFKSRDPQSLREWYRDRRVDDLESMLAQLRETGTKVLDRREDGENGKFGYVLDPEGNLLELWEQSDDDPSVPKE